MTTAADLIEEARSIEAEGLLSLIEEARLSQLRARSLGRLGECEVVAGLVKLPSEGELAVVGDLHGDLASLSFILEDSGALGGGPILLFLGDYGDRGPHSVEVYCVILRLLCSHPGRVILLRGNHEGPADLLAHPHDLPLMIKRRFGRRWEEVYLALRSLFDSLWVAALAEGRYVFLHGGAPVDMDSVEQLARAVEEHPRSSVLEQVLWNDPVEWTEGFAPSPRGAGYVFGRRVTERFLKVVGARTLVRAHEPCSEGVEVRHGGLVLTLFSRKGPPYMNHSAAYLRMRLGPPPLDARQLAAGAVRF
ncbi:MAG: metallophosphoesterase family protein [Candidatus Nezhaarchaeales archaeon]